VQGRTEIRELWIAEDKRSPRIRELVRLAEDRNIPISYRSVSRLSRLLPETAHQGVVAWTESFVYSELDQVMEPETFPSGNSLLIAADHITDEGNLGALVRTAAFFGSEGLILPKDRSARMTPQVLKRSSGGYLHLAVVSVVNLGRALDLLKKRGFWVIGASGDGPESIYRFDWRRNLVLVLGSEQKGLGRSVRERCDEVVRIPRPGEVESLNVAVAAGIILSEIFRQRSMSTGVEK
jgi:23S rRNA (guanosine2251-2'-O)-methyltransferase